MPLASDMSLFETVIVGACAAFTLVIMVVSLVCFAAGVDLCLKRKKFVSATCLSSIACLWVALWLAIGWLLAVRGPWSEFL